MNYRQVLLAQPFAAGEAHTEFQALDYIQLRNRAALRAWQERRAAYLQGRTGSWKERLRQRLRVWSRHPGLRAA